MPVIIEEVSAEVERPEQSQEEPSRQAEAPPQMDIQIQLRRLEQRKNRLVAD